MRKFGSRATEASLRLVRLFLQPLREQPGRVVEVVPPSSIEQFCARDAVWLFIREKSKLTPEEQEELLHIRSASVTVETTYALVQEFLTLVRERQGARLNTWIEAVQSSQIPELGRFVKGILQDKEAVVAGLTEVYSNGQTEGQVQKLKLVKRSMFGRAKLPLLGASVAPRALIFVVALRLSPPALAGPACHLSGNRHVRVLSWSPQRSFCWYSARMWLLSPAW